MTHENSLDAYERMIACARFETQHTNDYKATEPVTTEDRAKAIQRLTRHRLANASDMADAVIELDARLRAGDTPPTPWRHTRQ